MPSTNKSYQALVDLRMAEFDLLDRECIMLERAEAATLAELPEFLASLHLFIRIIAEEKLARFLEGEGLNGTSN